MLTREDEADILRHLEAEIDRVAGTPAPVLDADVDMFALGRRTFALELQVLIECHENLRATK